LYVSDGGYIFLEKNKIFRVSLVYQLLFLEYSLLTIIVYYLSKREGFLGITLPITGGGDDGYFYWDQVQSFLNGGQIINTSIYPSLISRLVSAVGFEDVIVIRTFNYIGFILLVLVAALLLKEIQRGFSLERQIPADDLFVRTNLMLGVFFMCYLSLLMNANLSIYRDIWIYFFYTVSIYLMGKIIFQKAYRFLFLLLPGMFLLGGFRTYALVAFIVATVLNLFMRNSKNLMKYTVGAIIIFTIYYTFFIDLRLPIVHMSLRGALAFRQLGVEVLNGGSNMYINLNQSNIILFLLNYFYSFIGNLVGPFFWNINSGMQLLVFIFESIPMIAILYYLIKHRHELSKEEIFVLVYAIVWIAFIALSNDNIGTATRLRVNGWIPILLVFISLWSRNFENKRNVKQMSSGA